MGNLMARLEHLATVPAWEWPPAAGRTLREALTDSDSNTRLMAAELAWAVMDDDLAEILLDKVETELNPRIRAQFLVCFGAALQEAVENQGYFDDLNALAPETLSRVKDVLRRTYHDPDADDLVRRKALETAVMGELEWVGNTVRAAWTTEDEDWQSTAIYCMGFLPGFHREILDALVSDIPQLRYQAVKAVGNAMVDGAASRLIEIIEDEGEDEETRGEAMLALAQVAPAESDTRKTLQHWSTHGSKALREHALAAIDEVYVYSAMDGHLDALDDFDDDF